MMSLFVWCPPPTPALSFHLSTLFVPVLIRLVAAVPCSPAHGSSSCRSVVMSLTWMQVCPHVQVLLQDLRSCSDASDPVLQTTVPYGVAFHHSGLTIEERELLEKAFRSRIVMLLCCTSTLAAGVNLPAKRVIFRSPYVGRDFLTKARYMQMAGVLCGKWGLGTGLIVLWGRLRIRGLRVLFDQVPTTAIVLPHLPAEAIAQLSSDVCRTQPRRGHPLQSPRESSTARHGPLSFLLHDNRFQLIGARVAHYAHPSVAPVIQAQYSALRRFFGRYICTTRNTVHEGVVKCYA